MSEASKPRQLATAGMTVALVVASAVPVVQKLEGRRNDPYNDIAGILSVCDGETRNVERRRYSDAECDAMTRASLTRHAAYIARCYPLSSTPLKISVAFLSLAYNIGAQAFCGSTVARLARAGDLAGACAAIPMWNMVKNPLTGRKYVSNGLVNRRAVERQLCEQGL